MDEEINKIMDEEINTSGFYKNENESLLFGPNYVLNANYELRRETKDQHTYPTDGWYWFDSEEEARVALGVSHAGNGL